MRATSAQRKQKEPAPIQLGEVGSVVTGHQILANPDIFIGKTVEMGMKSPTYAPGWGAVHGAQSIGTAPALITSVKPGAMSVYFLIGLQRIGESSSNSFAVHLDSTWTMVKLAIEPDSRMILLRERLATWRYHTYVGADPEIFVFTEKGELLPAFEFLPKEPTRKGSAEHAYYDGYQAEYSFPPATCLDGHNSCIRGGLRRILAAAKSKAPSAVLSLRSTVDIPPDRLRNDDDKFVAFGCTPSLSVYGETFPTVDPREVPFRSAGGHMHFSLDAVDTKKYPLLVKELDRVLGVLSVSLFQYYDDPRRRFMYGRAGEYRKTSYGIEYRVLSNAWLCHPAAHHFVYELARNIIGQFTSGSPGKGIPEWDVTEDEARKCINNCDVALAHKLMERNSGVLQAIIQSLRPLTRYNQTASLRWLEIIRDGIHTALSTPDRPSAWWGLEDNSKWAGANMSYSTSKMMAHEKKMLD